MDGLLIYNKVMALKNRIYLIMEKLLAPLTDKIVCISEAEKMSALKENVCSESKLELIPNGIDVKTVREASPKDRKKLGINDNSLVIGMIGRLSTQKAPDVFIKAAKLIHDENPNTFFIIVGSGDEESIVQNYAQNNNIPLLITGWTDEPYSYLKIFDIAMLLSRWEGFGLAIAEYMAAEKNVIATNVDAIPTLIDDGVDGLLVEKDDIYGVRDKVMYLISHPDEAKKMRDKALAKVIEKYDISRVAKQHADMFRELMK